jgi:cyclopropane fatty-acyl-phospholipid synthase-like methyltransferase
MERIYAASDHYTALQRFYERLTGDFSIHLPLWLPGTQSLSQATLNAVICMADTCKIRQGDYVLDAGCGLGGTAFWLAKSLGARVLGISDSDPNIQRCRELAADRDPAGLTEFQTADLMKSPFADDTFNFVWNLESINYLCPKERYIQDVFRILKPGGVWVSMDRYGDFSKASGSADRRIIAPLTSGFYTPRHWEGVPALLAHMQRAGFVNTCYGDLTRYLLASPGKRLVGGRRTAMSVLAGLRTLRSGIALRRAYRIIQASFILMERGVMTYGLISGAKPYSAHSSVSSPPAR